MAEKKDTKPNNAGEQQPVNDEQQYQKKPTGGSRRNKEFSHLPSANRVIEKIPEKVLEFYSYKAIESKVFDKISTVRKILEKRGEAIITVYTSTHKITVRLYGPDKNYGFDILDIEEIV